MKLEATFTQLAKENKKAFIAYLPFGFPDIDTSIELLLFLQEYVDVIEFGLPFSDPLADGSIIQYASDIALNKGADTDKFFRALKRIRNKIKKPVVILTYFNPVYKFGIKRFIQKAQESNISGLMVVDLPLEEADIYLSVARKKDMDTVFFITPTTEDYRAKMIIKASRGFVYYISVTGITGPKNLDFYDIVSHIERLKEMSCLPICVGFGIHTPSQVKKIKAVADGVIVGSALVKKIENIFARGKDWRELEKFIRWLNV